MIEIKIALINSFDENESHLFLYSELEKMRWTELAKPTRQYARTGRYCTQLRGQAWSPRLDSSIFDS